MKDIARSCYVEYVDSKRASRLDGGMIRSLNSEWLAGLEIFTQALRHLLTKVFLEAKEFSDRFALIPESLSDQSLLITFQTRLSRIHSLKNLFRIVEWKIAHFLQIKKVVHSRV
jgi:DNA-binding MltR family transcriptional regulator